MTSGRNPTLPALGVALLALSPAHAQSAPDLPVVRPVMSCADLASTELAALGGDGSRVTAAVESEGQGGHLVCRVDGILAPAIGFRVELPMRTWTQRFLQVGCGGLCGRVSLDVGAADGCVPLAAGGFVLATTDMGHQGMGTDWGADPQKRADFAYRGVHLTAEASKVLIRTFYGQAPAFNYFSGCSDGGREALVEAQRFPDDFDGVIAGAAAMNFVVQNSMYHGWQARSNTGADGKAVLLADRLPILHDAVLKACDGLDGQSDGLIATPGACRFDPAVLTCPADASDTSACFTAAEVDTVRKLYDGPRDPATGERLTVGGPQFGSELAWAGVFVPHLAELPIMSRMIASQALEHLIFETEPAGGKDLDDLRFDRATFDLLRARHPLFDATDPDLSAFADSGGKLILWHGWADPHISPINTIAYHEAVRLRLGDERADGFERLYMLPGVHHCSGGEGPSLIDLLTPMMRWVEAGEAPDAVVTTQAAPDLRSGFGQPGGGAGPATWAPAQGGGGSDAVPPSAPMLPGSATAEPGRTRPVYPYPFVARWDGSGDPNAASSYRRGDAMARVEVPDWAGADFYEPYVSPRQ